MIRGTPRRPLAGYRLDVMRFAWKTTEQRVKATPRQVARAEVLDVSVEPVQKVSFDCLPVLVESGEEADYFPKPTPTADCRIIPRTPCDPPAFVNRS